MQQNNQLPLFPSEEQRRNAIFWYFFHNFDMVLCVSEEYEQMETMYPEEYQQFLKSIKTEQ